MESLLGKILLSELLTKPLTWIKEISFKIGNVFDEMNCLVFTGLETSQILFSLVPELQGGC